MKRLKIQWLLAVMVATVNLPVFAQNINWVANVSLGYKQQEFEQFIGDQATITAKPQFPTAGIGLTGVIQKFYVSANYDQSIKDYEDNEVKQDPSNNSEHYVYSRQDFNLTLGYSLTKEISVFAGYLQGNTDIDYRIVDEFDVVSLRGSDSLEESGLFIGGNYSFYLAKAGLISFNLAYAFLDGKYKFNSYSNITGSSSGTLNGDTTGLSIGAKYSNALSRAWQYSLGLKSNQYDFDADTPVGKFSTDDNFLIFNATINKVF